MQPSDEMNGFSCRTVLPWAALAGILLLYIAFIARLHPIDLFGMPQDDSIYFSSAKAIAGGKGYVLPSLPGEPPAANKYPVFYPWMLSWVWRWNPSFPANINDGVALTVTFGLVYITFAFVFFRGPMKLSDPEALLLTAFCALHPVVLFHSAFVVSDIPFAALGLGSLVIADRATERDGYTAMGIACGVLVGLSILIRTAGYPVALGILVAAILRKAWRQAVLFVSTVAIFFAFFIWEKLTTAKAILPAGWSTFGPGFRQTWLYYTDYIGFRRLSIVDLHVAGTLFLNQFLYLCTHLPGFFISPLFDRNILIAFLSTGVLLWLLCAGFVRMIRTDGWKPIYITLLLYVGVVLAWNYPDWDRFLIPFLPLFAAALWIEGKWIAEEVSRGVRTERRGETRVAALLVGIVSAVLALGISWNFVTNRARGDLLRTSRSRAELLIEKKQAYDWIQRNSPSGSRVISAEDGAVYLYTGRRSMGPIAMLPLGAFEPQQLQRDLDHINDVAAAIGAEYWLRSSDDINRQGNGTVSQLTARLDEIDGVLPELFRSTSGSVRIYGLGCLQSSHDPSCSPAEQVLFPEGRPNR